MRFESRKCAIVRLRPARGAYLRLLAGGREGREERKGSGREGDGGRGEESGGERKVRPSSKNPSYSPRQ